MGSCPERRERRLPACKSCVDAAFFMKKYVPIEKMQKKAKKALAQKQRGSWLGVNPTTRVIRSKKREKMMRAVERDARREGD